MNSNQIIEEDEIDLRELSNTIKENSLTILFITLLSITMATAYIYWTKSIYSSSTIISLDSKGNKGLGIGAMLSQAGFEGFGGAIGGDSDIEKAKVVLTSKKFLKNIINKLDISREYYIQKNFRKVEVNRFENLKILNIAIKSYMESTLK